MIIAATGHRPDKLGGHLEAVDNRLRALAADYLRTAGATRAISGMALGWDMAVAEAALDLGISLIAAIPFLGQDSRWPEESRARYRRILRAASSKIIVSPGSYRPWKMQRRNEWMVDHADRLVALWDGSDSGTASCIRYAKSAGKEFDNLWVRWTTIA